jgi:hypothetical protein
MKPSTRKSLLLLLLGVAMVLLSFEFAEVSEEIYTGHLDLSRTIARILENAGAVTSFVGVIMFLAASLSLSFSLHPKWTMRLGAGLLASFVVSFFVARPHFNGHSWTMFPVLLSVLGSLYSLIIFVIGFERWLKHRKSASTNS